MANILSNFEGPTEVAYKKKKCSPDPEVQYNGGNKLLDKWQNLRESSIS